MNIKLMSLALLPALALGACGGNNSTTNITTMESPAPLDNADMGNAMLTSAPATPGQMFADMAAASDMFEVEAGKLA
ncbi:MAG: hypothetical protein EON59_08950, partial [Alphaproteobacteria bacterium]